MKTIRTLLLTCCAMAFLTCGAVAGEKATEKTCCEKATADGKECKHKCCVAAHKDGKSCENCNPDKQDLNKKGRKSDKKADKQ